MSRRYLVAGLAEEAVAAFAAMVHDRMTEQLYTETLRSFRVDKKPEPVVSGWNGSVVCSVLTGFIVADVKPGHH